MVEEEGLLTAGQLVVMVALVVAVEGPLVLLLVERDTIMVQLVEEVHLFLRQINQEVMLVLILAVAVALTIILIIKVVTAVRVL